MCVWITWRLCLYYDNEEVLIRGWTQVYCQLCVCEAIEVMRRKEVKLRIKEDIEISYIETDNEEMSHKRVDSVCVWKIIESQKKKEKGVS